MLARPNYKTLVPKLWATCGRREREAGAGNEEEQSSPVPVAAAVEGTLVHGVGDNLRGLSQECGPRSVRSTCVMGLIPHVRRTDDKRVSSRRNEEGNVVSVRQAYALDSDGRASNATPAARGHVLRSLQRPVHVNRH